jgi:hypothetical protein
MNKKAEREPGIAPPQYKGGRKDIDHAVIAANENDARKLFMAARSRLVDVNHWEDYAKPVSATFRLTDAGGLEVNRTAEIGDHFKIRLPAPGPVEGRGYDWVRIEAIEDVSNGSGRTEHIAIRVRPAPSPEQKGENVAHFFNDDSTSSFVLERRGKEITAAVYGRNEVPNTETSNTVDKVRNAVVGVTAMLGLSNIQWKNLVKGLLETR